jgi:hypothetical protein
VRRGTWPPGAGAEVEHNRWHEDGAHDESVEKNAEGNGAPDLDQDNQREGRKHGKGRCRHDAGRRDQPACEGLTDGQELDVRSKRLA